MKTTFKLSELEELFKAHDIAIISAERTPDAKEGITPAINKKNTNELESLIKSSIYDYEPSTGGFVENQGTNDEHPVDGEASFLVVDVKNKGSLKSFAGRLGVKFGQDSVLVSARGSLVAFFLGTTNRKGITPAKGATAKVGTLKVNNKGLFYTKIKDGYFTFS